MAYVTEDNLTDVALERWNDIPDPRLRQIMQSLIKHLHGFVRDIEPTQAEWATAIDWLTRTGKLSSEKRQEFILTSDVLGVSMLVDAISHRRPSGATPSTVEGPFHVPNPPPISNGGDMAQGAPGVPCFVTGTVRGRDGEPIAGAVLDLWQTDGEGHYEAQRDASGPWMRGLYRTQGDGSYVIRTVAPIAYAIPMDGTVGELMERTNISHMRPAHIHFAISAPGYHGCVTHLFRKGDAYIETDVVYGVKEPLIVDFVEQPPGTAPTGVVLASPFYEVKYDFVLQRSGLDSPGLRQRSKPMVNPPPSARPSIGEFRLCPMVQLRSTSTAMPSTERPFHIRDASADELDAISKLTLAVYEQYATIMTPPAWEGLKGSVMNGLATTAPVERIVAEQKSELVGCVMLFPAAVNAYGNLTGQAAISELRLLAVTPAARGHGIGRALVEECIERTRKAGEKELGIHTSISMQAAIHLYESMGFTRFPADDFQPEGAELVTAYRLSLS